MEKLLLLLLAVHVVQVEAVVVVEEEVVVEEAPAPLRLLLLHPQLPPLRQDARLATCSVQRLGRHVPQA